MRTVTLKTDIIEDFDSVIADGLENA